MEGRHQVHLLQARIRNPTTLFSSKQVTEKTLKIYREKINGEEPFSIPMWPKDDIPLYKKLIIFTKPRVLPIGTGQGFVILLSGLPYLPD